VLGLSLTKILFTILVVVAVWKGFRLLKRLQEQRAERARRPAPARRTAAATHRPASPPFEDALELDPCPLCGTYVPRGTRCASIARCVRRREGAAEGRG